MGRYPYLRAYMAGSVAPTAFLLVILTGFTTGRHVWDVPIPLERVIVFPMAVVPNVWGLWNMLHLWLRSRRHLPLGLHGAVLPFLLAPAGFLITRAVGFTIPAFAIEALPFVFPVAVVIYYLVWKHLVGFFNELLGIAGKEALP